MIFFALLTYLGIIFGNAFFAVVVLTGNCILSLHDAGNISVLDANDVFNQGELITLTLRAYHGPLVFEILEVAFDAVVLAFDALELGSVVVDGLAFVAFLILLEALRVD